MNMNHTNINITGDNKIFNYIIEYSPTDVYWEDTDDASIHIKYVKKYNRIDIINDLYKHIKFSSDWIDRDEYIRDVEDSYNSMVDNNIVIDNDVIPLSKKYLPKRFKTADVKVYFPIFSVDTYHPTLYMLTANTWVNGKYVYLGSYILNRMDALAVSQQKIFNNERYYEYVDINIIDPYEMIYGDNWKEWRNKVCGEPIFTDINNEYNFNNTGSLLNFTLYPIDKLQNTYIPNTIYMGGQNSINITNNKSDYFGINIEEVFVESGKAIKFNINFNSYYDKDLNLYLKETYNIDNPILKCRLIILDKNDQKYEYYESEAIILKNQTNIKPIIFHKSYINDLKHFNTENHFNLFDSWDNWKPGLVLMGAMTIYTSSEDFNDSELLEEDLLYLLSNEIPITKELYKYLLIDSFDINYINLDKLNMNHYNITTVNKVVNNIIDIDRPENSKSNIIQPIFFKTRDLNNIIIHPEVTENICINLDQYKSKVKNFTLQVEGIKFNQTSSITQGIVFKIVGNKLPNKKTDGVFYILNENGELVTTGKYIYEQ